MNVFQAAAEAWRTGRPAAFVTIIGVGGSTPRSSGARMLVYSDGSAVGTIGGGNLELLAIRHAKRAIEKRAPVRWSVDLVRELGMCCGGQMEVYVEPLTVQAPIGVFGAGHVAHAVVPLLHALDFDVTVVDARPEMLTETRFPDAARHCADPGTFARNAAPDANAYWLVVTHDHALDQEIVEALLSKPAAWVGMIGSKAKVTRFLERFRSAGMPEHQLAQLCAPVGLDIGAETPAEIAVAIAAELVRVRRYCKRPPAPLSSAALSARGHAGAVPALWAEDDR